MKPAVLFFLTLITIIGLSVAVTMMATGNKAKEVLPVPKSSKPDLPAEQEHFTPPLQFVSDSKLRNLDTKTFRE